MFSCFLNKNQAIFLEGCLPLLISTFLDFETMLAEKKTYKIPVHVFYATIPILNSMKNFFPQLPRSLS
jgi:hypothetical protein